MRARVRDFLVGSDAYDEDEGVDVGELSEEVVAVVYRIVHGTLRRTRRASSSSMYRSDSPGVSSHIAPKKMFDHETRACFFFWTCRDPAG